MKNQRLLPLIVIPRSERYEEPGVASIGRRQISRFARNDKVG